jgi:hypothetical protein
MPIPRRALAALPATAVALAASAPPTSAATVQTQPCVPYVQDRRQNVLQSMTIIGTGFTPNGFVALAAAIAASTTTLPFNSVTALPNGSFAKTVAPPAFSPPTRNLQSFTLVASEATTPTAPTIATFNFQLVRFGMTLSPRPRRPVQRVLFAARGWVSGRPVFVHFRYGGITRRTVSLGVARGPCGMTSRRMRALPTKARIGNWRMYVDQSARFSLRTDPQWIDGYRICRGPCPLT